MWRFPDSKHISREGSYRICISYLPAPGLLHSFNFDTVVLYGIHKQFWGPHKLRRPPRNRSRVPHFMRKNRCISIELSISEFWRFWRHVEVHRLRTSILPIVNLIFQAILLKLLNLSHTKRTFISTMISPSMIPHSVGTESILRTARECNIIASTVWIGDESRIDNYSI